MILLVREDKLESNWSSPVDFINVPLSYYITWLKENNSLWPVSLLENYLDWSQQELDLTFHPDEFEFIVEEKKLRELLQSYLNLPGDR
jgi:hypothetical protein